MPAAFETVIGPETIALIRSYYKDGQWLMTPQPRVPELFDSEGRLNMSPPFRAGLEQFLAVDADVFVPRPEDDACPTFDEACAQWRQTRDRFILFLFRKFVIAQQRVCVTFDPSVPSACYGFYGAYPGAPRRTALMFSRREEFFRYGPRDRHVVPPFAECRVI